MIKGLIDQLVEIIQAGLFDQQVHLKSCRVEVIFKKLVTFNLPERLWKTYSYIKNPRLRFS